MRTLQRVFLVSIVALSALAPAASFAQAENKGSATFVDMEAIVINANHPAGPPPWMEGHKRPKFKRLLKLQKSLRPAMLATGSDLKLK